MRHIGNELRALRLRMRHLEEHPHATANGSREQMVRDFAGSIAAITEILLTFRESGDVTDNYVTNNFEPPNPHPAQRGGASEQ